MASHPLFIQRYGATDKAITGGLSTFIKVALGGSSGGFADFEKSLDRTNIYRPHGVYSAAVSPAEMYPILSSDSPYANPINSRSYLAELGFGLIPGVGTVGMLATFGGRNVVDFNQRITTSSQISDAVQKTLQSNERRFEDVRRLRSAIADTNKQKKQTEAELIRAIQESLSKPDAQAPEGSKPNAKAENQQTDKDQWSYLLPLLTGSGGFLLGSTVNPLLGLLLGGALAGLSYYGYKNTQDNTNQSPMKKQAFNWKRFIMEVLAWILAETGAEYGKEYLDKTNTENLGNLNMYEEFNRRFTDAKRQAYSDLQRSLTLQRISNAVKQTGNPNLMWNYLVAQEQLSPSYLDKVDYASTPTTAKTPEYSRPQATTAGESTVEPTVPTKPTGTAQFPGTDEPAGGSDKTKTPGAVP